MPAKPSYSHRLAPGICFLETLDTPWVDRRQLEEALGVSKTVAWRILRQCGAESGPGGALVCHRTSLLDRLRQLQTDGGIHEREIRRRDRLERLLENLRPSVIANLTPVARDREAIQMLSSTFRKLPGNVTLQPGSLHIDFTGPEDFLKAMGALIFALHNDYEEIHSFLTNSAPKTVR